MPINAVPLGEWGIFPEGFPVLIAGPCSAESREQVLASASAVSDASIKVFRAGLWKPRTHCGCFEGVGEEGIPWLLEARERFGLKICTEVSSASHVDVCLKAGMDLLWIGARTTANPFLVRGIADALKGSGVPVLVKNPMAEDLALWCGAFERLQEAGISKFAAVLRGFPSFERSRYRNEPRWESVLRLREMIPGLPVFCDPSHISGDAALVSSVVRRARAFGIEAFMIESHCCPREALSDASQQLDAAALKSLAEELRGKRKCENLSDATVYEIRSRIDLLDESIVRNLADRMDLCREIARIKYGQGASVVQPERWNAVLAKVEECAASLGLAPEYVRSVFNTIHETSVKEQNIIISRYAENQDKG